MCDEHGSFLWTLRRETFLLLAFLILILLFAVTGFAVHSYLANQRVLRQAWFACGGTDLGAGRAVVAVKDFRRALV